MKEKNLWKGNHVKGFVIAALTGISMAALGGCGTDRVQEDAAGTESSQEAELSAEKEQGEQEIQTAKIRHYYAGVLSELVCTCSLPDIELEMLDDSFYKMSDNRFAIADVDGDGREELLISYTTASMAGMLEVMYDYNPQTNRLKQECLSFPSLTYYNNGMIKAEASHNHSMGMDFWPFALYRYQEESDTYAQIGYVDTWSKEIADIYDGQSFPDELDTDGDGVLYNIQNGSEPSYEFSDYQYNEADYKEWYDSIMAGADEIRLDYKPVDYEEFQAYTTDYLKLVRQSGEEKAAEDSTDIGLLYCEENYSIEELEQFVSANYGVEIEQVYEDSDEEQVGKYKGSEVFRFSRMDEGMLTYEGEKVGDITIFGIYPGMGENAACEALKTYGFYAYDEAEITECFITGEGLGNRSVWFTAEDGKITLISVHPFCKFAG